MYNNQENTPMGGGSNAGSNGDQMQQQQSLQQQRQQNVNYNGAQPKQQQQPTHAQVPSQQQQQQQQTNANKKIAKKAYVKIVEQPASKALRFRYECEGRSAGSIPGVNSTPETKTFPTIEIIGYKGRAVVVVSCVTKDAPYRPHPHNLVGKEGCKKGVCTLEINSETMRAVFSNLGIQCVKKKDIESALKAREDIRVDPFKTGFSHRFQPTSIDLNAVRLCFQVFLKGDMGRFTVPLPPVVSEPIFDKKAMSDLIISRICSCSATVLGNTKIILLCEKVAKEDIAVRFFEEKDGVTIWQAFGDFEHNDVHKQTAITFRTPKYHKTNITEPVEVYVQLQRPSDGAVSDPVKFEYVPAESGPEELRRKRQRTDGDSLLHASLQQQQKKIQSDHPGSCMPTWNTPNIPTIKTEPREASPQPPFTMYRAPSEMTPSPQPLSPANNYNLPNTPSPYNMAMGGKTPLMSPNQQYRGGTPNIEAAAPSPMEMHNDYSAYGGGQHQQQQQQQLQQQHSRNYVSQQQLPPQHVAHQQHQQQQQQQYHGVIFNNTDMGNWEEKFANVLANVGTANEPTTATTLSTMNNLNNNSSNNNNNNHINMQNMLGASVTNTTGVSQHTQWNFPPNVMQDVQQHHHHLQSQQQQQQQQLVSQTNFQQHQQLLGSNTGSNANNADITGNGSGEQGPTISNLLNFDSEQLVHINSEEQQMLRLTSEELRLSNLSISS